MSFAQFAQCISECLGPTETHKDLKDLKKQGQVQRGCLHVVEFPSLTGQGLFGIRPVGTQGCSPGYFNGKMPVPFANLRHPETVFRSAQRTD